MPAHIEPPSDAMATLWPITFWYIGRSQKIADDRIGGQFSAESFSGPAAPNPLL